MMIYIVLFIKLSLISLSMHANMIRDMSVMMGAQLGASIANTTVSSMYQEVAQGIQKDQTNMSIASKAFLADMQNAQQAQIQSMFNVFSQAGQQVSTLMSQQTSTMQAMQSYIESIVSLQSPQPDYLASPINWDQTYEQATMYTPQGLTWKNIFQIGNWQFDETNNSFWQMSVAPFLTPTTDQTTATASTSQTAYQNSIFTEWITHNPYEISCTITIYQVTYPFYAGVMFNKARWISGDVYGLQKYRTLGIYGDVAKKVSVCYSDQIITQSPQGTSAAHPLEQIYQGKGAQKIILNQESFQNIQAQPIILNLKIKPGPTSVEYKIWFNGEPEPKSYIMIKTTTQALTSVKKSIASTVTVTENGTSFSYLSSNSNDDYLYHGIGFLSPGAITQFKLTSPQQILYAPSAIESFTTEFNASVTQALNASATKELDAGLLSQKE